MNARSTANASAVPRGREEVTAALVAAAERLCETESPSVVSVRGIAEEANVTTALVYFYFESRDDLIRETLRSLATEIDARASTMEGPSEMVREVASFFAERPAFPRILASMVLEGRDVTDLMGDHPFLRRLMISLGAPGDAEALSRAGILVAFLLGAGLYREAINRALGRDRDDPALGRALADALAELGGAT